MAEKKTVLAEKEHVEPNTMKRRMVLLWKLLYDQTDEDHPVTTYDIVDYMAEHSIKVSRKTIKPDVDLMIECGFDIVTTPGKPNKYFWGTRDLQLPEIKLLIDAVSSSRFLTKKKSDELKHKLTGLASIHQRDQLSRHIYTTNVVKQRNESIYYTVDRINDAIEKKRKISFQIIEFDGKRRKTHRGDGETYVVSPYAMYWNDDFYYVVGWCDKHQDVSAFRADRMDHLDILDEKAVRRPKGFRISDYSHKVFEMFNGEEVTVRLQCKDHLMKYVMDRFGDKFKFEPGEDGTFTCDVDVCLSPTFYGWVFGFGGDIRILSPDDAVKQMLEMSRQMIDAESVVKKTVKKVE